MFFCLPTYTSILKENDFAVGMLMFGFSYYRKMSLGYKVVIFFVCLMNNTILRYFCVFFSLPIFLYSKETDFAVGILMFEFSYYRKYHLVVKL